MPDLTQLGLNEDSAPQVDWDAPEAGKTPPPVFPGTYSFLFKLSENTDDWFDAVEREVVKGQPKRKFLEITYIPAVVADSEGRPLANDDGSPLMLGPQRVNAFMSAKMHIHQIAELFRAMGTRYEKLIENGGPSAEVVGLLKQLDGQATFKGELIWRAYFRSTDTTISTHPRKKGGELPWPRNAQGQPELMAKNPNTGETAYGYAEIVRFKLPTAAAEGGQENLGASA